MKKLFVLFIAAMMFVGCNGMSLVRLPEKSDDSVNSMIGEKYDIVVVKTRDWVSPSTTTVMVFNKETGEFTKVEGGTGPGGLGTLAGPAATAYAGHEIGKGIGDSGDQSTINNGSASGSVAGSASVSKSAAAAKSASASAASAKAAQMQGQAMAQGQGQLQDQGQLQGQGQGQVGIQPITVEPPRPQFR